MRIALLTFLVLLGYVAVLGVAFLLLATRLTKRFSRFWRPCFYLCSVALVALLLLIPISGPRSDDFANNSAMFWPLVLACLALPFVAFKKSQRYIVLSAVILGLAAFFLVLKVSRLGSLCAADCLICEKFN
jgi:cytochrome bd-type quinol oxidase subunit 2